MSVCVPVYRSEPWIGAAIESVLEQTYDDFEIVVTDNQSPDGTVGVVRGFDDPRLRLHVNEGNLGPVANHNRAIQHATGSLIKVLHADDRLLPTCLERMVAALDAHPRAGFVFAPRRIELEPDSPPALTWFMQRISGLHWGFERLGPINDGRRLFEQYLRAGFPWNWVGEQTAVMIRRECFERLGLFNVRIWQAADMEMWSRTMLAYDVAFVDEPLVVYRFGHDNLTHANTSVDRHWLDRLWTFETLMAQEPPPAFKSALAGLRRTEYVYVGRDMARAVMLRHHVARRTRDIAEYAAFRLGRGRPVEQVSPV